MTKPVHWPAGLRQFPRRDAFNGGPVDTRAAFQTEIGVPIHRARFTANPETYDATFPNLTQSDLVLFRAFITSLGRGVSPFAWRDPVIGDPARWKILGNGARLYDVVPHGADRHDLTLKLMRLPGTPWWAAYVRPGKSVVPDVVADWNAGVFGIDGAKVAASALPAVAGTFDVWSVSSTDVESFSAGVVIAPGGIPATAPALVKRRVYFAP